MKSILFFDDEPYTALEPFLDRLQFEKINYIVVNRIYQLEQKIKSTLNLGLIVIDLHHQSVIEDASLISSALDIIKIYVPNVSIAIYTNFSEVEMPEMFKMLNEIGVTTILYKSMNFNDVFKTFYDFVKEE